MAQSDELYGRDIYCVDSLRPGRWATGKQVLAQRLYHRLITPPGTLLGGDQEADFGIDLASIVGSTNDKDLESTLPTDVINELRKDPEVDSVKVTATRVKSAGQTSWTLSIEVTPNTVGPFELVVSVTDVTVELLGVR